MKKSLIFALTALLAVSFTFFGCPSNPSDGGSDSEKENPDTPDTPSVEEEDLDIGNFTWSFNATYDADTKTITLTDAYGAGSIGWNDAKDFSSYKTLNVVISSYNNDWGKIYLQDATAPIDASEVQFTTIKESTTKTIDLTKFDASAIKQFSIQGKAEGDKIVVERVYLTK